MTGQWRVDPDAGAVPVALPETFRVIIAVAMEIDDLYVNHRLRLKRSLVMGFMTTSIVMETILLVTLLITEQVCEPVCICVYLCFL